MSSEIKQRAASTILEKGVRVAILTPSFKYVSRGVPEKVDVILYQPTMGELIEISAIITEMGLDSEALALIDLAGSYRLLSRSGRLALKALRVATRLKFDYLSDGEIEEILSAISPAEFRKAWQLFIKHSGVADFIDSTRLMTEIDSLNPQIQRSGQSTQQ